MENYVLFQCYISHCIPESYVGSAILGECQEGAGGETGAAEVNISVNIVICHIELPGSRSLWIYVAIAETCIPCGVIVGWGSGVLPVFTEYTEVVERNVEGSSQQFSVVIASMPASVQCTCFIFVTGKADVIHAEC